MIRLAEGQRRRTEVDITFIGVPGEQIPLEDASVDTVLSTFTLCTIPGVVEALRGVRRVLKPGGKLIFFEHGASPDPRVRRWQEWSEPIPHWLFEGCHVTRDIPSLIVQSGFASNEWRRLTWPGSRRRGRIAGGVPRHELPARASTGTCM